MNQTAKSPLKGEAYRAPTEEQLLELYVREFCLSRHIGLKDLLDRLERQIICMALARTNGSQRAAARMLGVRPSTLNYKIQNLGLIHVHKYLTTAEPSGTERPAPAAKTAGRAR